MSLTDRRIKCEISKTVQEVQFEPFQITLTLEGAVDDNDDITKLYHIGIDLLEEIVTERINNRLT